MSKAPRLEDKIRVEIQQWYNLKGHDFVLVIKEFCQGNRTCLSKIMEMVKDLGTDVFAGQGEALNTDLLEDLEYAIFDLIGKFTSTPGGDELLTAIQGNIVAYLTTIFAEIKKQWNLNQYKITASYNELDPTNELIPALETVYKQKPDCIPALAQSAQHQARDLLDELVLFAKNSFRGEKKREIAINWLENPQKIRDFYWLSSLAGTSTGSTKVILTRIKHSFTKVYDLKTVSNKLVLVRSDESG